MTTQGGKSIDRGLALSGCIAVKVTGDQYIYIYIS